jgi:hypothetical protein
MFNKERERESEREGKREEERPVARLVRARDYEGEPKRRGNSRCWVEGENG